MKIIGRSSHSFLLAILGLLVFLGPVSMRAQLPTGTILGVVKDSSDNIIVGAKVTVRNDEGMTRSFTTDSTGSFRFPALPVGKYAIEVSQTGFKKVTVKDITLTLGQEAALSFVMQVGSVSESVEVKSDVVMVDTTSSSLGGLVSENTIAELPLNGRNYVDLTLLQPGITQHTQENAGQGITGTIYSSDGAPVRSNNVMIDGTSTSNGIGLNASSVLGTTLGMDGVKEYKVITNLASAEYYSGMGSQTTIVSKAGGSKLTGDVFEYLRNSSLDANNYFNLPAILEQVGKRIPAFRRNQFGGAVGGPLQKDKTFFFINYEGLRETTGNPLYQGVDNTFPSTCWEETSDSTPSWRSGHKIMETGNPCAWLPSGFPLAFSGNTNGSGNVNPTMKAIANLYPYPNSKSPYTGLLSQYVYASYETGREDYGQVRVDHNFSATNSGFIRYTIDNANLQKPDPYPEFRDQQLSQSQYLTMAENHIFSSALLNSARLSFSRTNISTISLPANAEAAAAVASPGETSLIYNPSDTSGDCINGNCMIGLIIADNLTTMGPSTVAPGYMIQNLISFGDDLFWTKGKHSIKAGILINHYDIPQETDLIFGSVNVMPSIINMAEAPGDLLLNGFAVGQSFMQQATTSLPFNQPAADTKRNWDSWTFGAYIQDDYRMTSRLTMNLGLRYEPATVPSDKNGKNWALSNMETGDMNCSITNNPATCIAQKGAIWKNATLKNFSPRVGFAWDPQGNGKTSIKAGYGIYYDIASMGSKLGQQADQVPPLADIYNILDNYMTSALPPFMPFTIPHTATEYPLCTSDTAGSLNPFAGTGSACLIPQIGGNEYRPKTTYLQQYNLAIQRQLPGNSVLSVAYTGSRGIHIRRMVEGNPVIPCNMPNSLTATNDPDGCTASAAAAVASGGSYSWDNGKNPVWDVNLYPGNTPLGKSYRKNPNVAAQVLNSTDGDSYYNALQTSFAKQLSRGLQFQVGFTWSKLQDTTQGDLGSNAEGSNLPTNPFNSSTDKGPTAFDTKANLRTSMVYNIPNVRSNAAIATLAKGWTFSNIVSFQSGYPFECMVQYGNNSGTSNSELGVEDIGGNLSNDRCDFVTASNYEAALQADPDAVLYDKDKVIQHKPSQWFNPHMFTVPQAMTANATGTASGRLGNTPRGLMRGPGQTNWDLSLVKNTHFKLLGENGGFQFRVDAFNVLNHTNFAFPYTNNFNTNTQALVKAGNGVQATNASYASDVTPHAGEITNTLINARQIQFAIKLDF